MVLGDRRIPLVPERALELARAGRRRIEMLDRALTATEFTGSLMRDQPVLIYSMGKVGTSSLAESIARGTSRPVVKCHYLTKAGIDESTRRHYQIGETARPRTQWQHRQLARVVALDRRRTWEMICGVREPVARSVSAYFHGLRRRQELSGEPGTGSGDLEFHGAGVARSIENTMRYDWFAEELRPTTGIDVYRSAFPWADGFETYRHGRFRATVIRQEDLGTAGPAALARVLGCHDLIELSQENSAPAEAPDSVHRRFLRDHRFAEELITRAYESTQARHFYSPAERERLIARWTTGT